ncbi:hypothetical protein PTSG_06607 [Salpingoeca rosetta]|uniref:BRISC and BRCA1-A complex member 2 n=1 Tax=Salpingoeca rosetta (strain ATCC 50818 / BSB-021) TaxID=946362 RepID=F2UFG9_SALR5|nr:uncharacterized protein PTSG_06607 [Salpingoeca rosetta]EGD75537.1 hypothetical protein PTSG_06607 [Salpingoeca rosetta]|eukprot:XP_004991994.1 hypothetical protein PTSG_06607 [Salpingoeca rosetta]
MMQTSDIEGGGGGGLKVLRQCVSNLQAREQTSGCTFITITPSKASSSQYTLQFQRAGQPCAWTIIMGSGSQSIPDICFPSFEQSFEPSIDALLPVLDAWDGSTTSYTDFFAIVLKVDQFHVLLHVRISSRFPEQQPTLILQSVYHDDAAGHPIRTQYSEYPYSPRWHGTELATRIRTFLLEEVPRFKQSSIKKHR